MTAPPIHSTILRVTKLSCFFREHPMPSFASPFRSHSKKLSKHGTLDFNLGVSNHSSSSNSFSWHTSAPTEGCYEPLIVFFPSDSKMENFYATLWCISTLPPWRSGPQRIDGHHDHEVGNAELQVYLLSEKDASPILCRNP